MQKILRNRVLRNLKANIFRYIALGFLILLGMYIVISLVGAAETIITGVDEKARNNKVEDGDFTLYAKLTKEQTQYLKDHYKGLMIEEKFYMDYLLENESVIRVFKNRDNINLVEIDSGRLAEKDGELVIEKRYAKENKLHIGDEITLGENTFIITGIGSSPDYDAPYRNVTDSTIDSQNFGITFVNENAYDTLSRQKNSIKAEEYQYAYILGDYITDRELKEEIKNLLRNYKQEADLQIDVEGAENIRNIENIENIGNIGNIENIGNVAQNVLTDFVTQEDNIRIKGSADDQIVNRNTGLFAGVIAMILFTYVISVFVVHEIESESSVIGTLYALGVRRKELLRHYIFLPVLVTLIGGVLGTLLGYSPIGVRYQMQDCYTYFSLPELDTKISSYLLIYGIFMPPVVAYIVNYIVIKRKLDKPALKLIRNEQKISRVRNIKLGNMGFISRFRIRQILREQRTGITIFFGMFLSLLIMMIGLNTFTLCKNVSRDYKEDPKFEYMYTYKYPDEEVIAGGEACYAKTFKKENIGYQFDVTMLGIDEDNPYFDVSTVKSESNSGTYREEMDGIEEEHNISKVIISSSMSQKYGLKKGDKFTVVDEENDREYSFTVADVTQYAVSYYMFADINDMRKMFEKPENYYNVVLSDHALAIDAEKLYATTTKADIVKGSDVMIDLMYSLIYMVTGVSAVIFAIVMYLMMKVMLDRSALNISLMQVFGFRTKEIKKLYLDGNFYIIIISAAIGIPLAKIAMDALFPYMIANVGCPMDIAFEWWLYAIILLAVILLYFMINTMLVRRIKKVTPADVLKNRE